MQSETLLRTSAFLVHSFCVLMTMPLVLIIVRNVSLTLCFFFFRLLSYRCLAKALGVSVVNVLKHSDSYIVVKCCAVLVTDSLSLNYTLLKFRDRGSVKAFYNNFYLV